MLSECCSVLVQFYVVIVIVKVFVYRRHFSKQSELAELSTKKKQLVQQFVSVVSLCEIL